MFSDIPGKDMAFLQYEFYHEFSDLKCVKNVFDISGNGKVSLQNGFFMDLRLRMHKKVF